MKKTILPFLVLGALLTNTYATPMTFPPTVYSTEEAASAVAVTVTYDKDAPSITLNFPGRTEDYGIERRVWGTTAWTVLRAGSHMTLPPVTKISSWTDTNIAVGTAYEYRVRGEFNYNLDGGGHKFYPYGFVLAGIEVDKTGDKGRMILLVDNTVPAELPFEYNRLKEDLIGEGWRVNELQVAPATTWGGNLGAPADNQAAWAIREQIKTIYSGAPTNDKPKFVYILGHVPVPWSGSGTNYAPDGHGNHTGAYPTDCFYAETNGSWLDLATYDENSAVRAGDTTVQVPRQFNFPGDKIYDKQYIEYISPLEMGFGRVDFFGMSTYFRMSEKELLRRYLDKAHNYRHLKNDMAVLGTTGRRMLLRNGFTTVDLTMHRWASTTVGIENFEYSEAYPGGISYGNIYGPYLAYFPANEGSGYLGEYEKDLHTALFAKYGTNAAFYGGFQSYRYDWGLDNNQILAFIAAEGLSLGYATAHGPHLLHFTGLGENFGLCIRKTLNDNSTTMAIMPPYLPPTGTDYPNYSPANNVRAGGVFMGWIGDPSLKLFPVLPASNLTATGGASVSLNWTASSDTAIQGYNVYRASAMNGTWTKLNTGGFITGTSFSDASPLAGKNIYAVRAVKLESTGSGSYFNEAQSVFATYDSAGAIIAPSVATLEVGMNRGTHSPSTGGLTTIANSGSGAFSNPQAVSKNDWLSVVSFDGTNLQVAPNANADTLPHGTHKGTILLTATNADAFYLPVLLTVNGQGGVFDPVADTLADGKSGYTNTNYGTNQICDVSKNDRRIYQKFDLSSELGQVVERAVLSIVVTEATAPQLDVYAFNDNSWSEATLTYNARPDDANVGDLIATQTGSGAGTMNFDVTEFVESRIMEDGMISFMVKCPVEPFNIAKIAMREGYGVYLTVDFGGTVTSWLNLSARDFYEDDSGNGTMNTSSPVVATLTGADTFTGSNGEDFVANGKALVTNLPAGLTAVITRTSDTTLSIVVNGSATNHNHDHSISNLSIRFSDSAFSGGARQNVMGFSANGLRVNFNGLIVLNDADSGPGSLRQAVADAPDGSVLTFDPAISKINLAAEIAIAKSVTLEGKGRITIDGGNTTRLFNINGTGSQTVAFKRIVLQNGKINGNSGGAIYVMDGTLVAEDASFLNNRAEGTGDDGGAVSVRSTVTHAYFTRCYFADSYCDDDGGAIYAQSAVTMVNSTFYQNISGDQGGVIFSDNLPAKFYNCTLLNNNAGGGEGVIQVAATDGTAELYSTVLYNPTAPYEIETLNSTILPSVTLTNCFGNFQASRMPNYGTRITATGGVNSASSPLLSNPANNDGFTKTAAIQAGSPLIGAGSNPLALTTDQRGAGYARQDGANTDIGAFESISVPYAEIALARGATIADESGDIVYATVMAMPTELTYTVSNIGTAGLTLGTAVVSGETNCSAVIGTQPSASVSAGAATNLVVTVTPTSAGAWSFSLSLPNNDANENPYNWTVSGTATATAQPEIAVSLTGTIADGGSNSVLNSLTGTGRQLTYTIINSGSADLSLSPTVKSGENNCSVTIDTQPSATVAPGGSTTLVVTVTPTAASLWSFSLSIANNDADENPYNWTVSGTATNPPAPGIAVTRGGALSNSGTDSVSGSVLATPVPLTYTIINSGSLDLTLAAAILSGETNCTATINTQPASSVVAGGNTSLVVIITPTAADAWSFSLSVANNVSGASPFQWIVSGTATSVPVPVLSYSRTVFAEKTENDGSIDNSAPLTISLINETFTGTNGDDFVAGGKLLVSNLPAGLTAVATRTSDTELSVVLNGSATSHATTHDVANLSFTFQNSAFTGGVAGDVTDAVKSDLAIDFTSGITNTVFNPDDTGEGSLRAIVASAVAGSTIDFDPAITSITLTTGEIAIAKNLTIDGAGAVTISGNDASRIFNISGTGNTVTLRGLTLTDGKRDVADADAQGGAIYNDGPTLTLENCTVQNSLAIASASTATARNGEGGGIFHNSGTLILVDSTVKNNTANTLYGGLTGARQSYGGGIYVNGAATPAHGNLTLIRSTISGNTAIAYTVAVSDGGGLYLVGEGTVKIVNSTISGNSAHDQGGGIYVDDKTMDIYNSTITANSSTDDLEGAGINVLEPAVVRIYSTILSGNTGASDIENNATTTLPILEKCVYGTVRGDVTANNSVISSAPLLSALADNGGATQTHALQTGSPARNIGSIEAAQTAGFDMTNDQRGTGYARISGGACDIGAFEFEVLASEITVTRSAIPVNDGGSDPVIDTVAGSATQLTYTITNSGAATLTLESAIKASETNCAVTINTQPAPSVTAGNTTSLVVTVTPTAAGAWSFALSVGNNDADENPYNWTVSGTAQAANPYAAWKATHGLDINTGAPGADPDGDGIDNLAEFALNLDPTLAVYEGLPLCEVEGANLKLTYRKNKAAANLTYTVQSSPDLAVWTDETAGSNLGNIDDDTESWQFTKAVSGGKLFLRLKVVEN